MSALIFALGRHHVLLAMSDRSDQIATHCYCCYPQTPHSRDPTDRVTHSCHQPTGMASHSWPQCFSVTSLEFDSATKISTAANCSH